MLIEVQGMKKTYQMGEAVVPALRGVSLSIDSGDFVAIMGPSGSGKSTLMHLLGLLDIPDSGFYQLAGKEIAGLSEDELSFLRGKMIGFVFQQFNLIPRTSALENVALPLLYTQGTQDPLTLPKQLLEQVSLAGRIHHKPNELSGGQQQRVAIARALVNQPKIILADEPTGNLDTKSQEEIMKIFEKLNEQGMTVVLVTHEEEVARHAKRIIKMRDGLILSDESLSKEENSGGVLTKIRAPAKTVPVLFQETKRSAFSLFEASEHFKQAWRAVSANKVRTGLSMLGILIGVAAVIAMLALGSGAKASLEQQLSAMGSNLLVLRPGSPRMRGVALQAGESPRFTLADADAIRTEIPSVNKISPTVSGRGQIVFGNKNWNSQVIGATPEYAQVRLSNPVLGRFFSEEENRRRVRVALLGQTVIRELFPDSSPLGEMIKINRINFQVIGVLPEKGATSWRDQDDVVVIPLLTAMKRVFGKDYLDSIDIEVQDQESMQETQEKIQKIIMRNHRLPLSRADTFEVRNMAEIQAALSETSRTMTYLLGSIAAVSLLVGGIGIMNIMLVSVTERTREIGLRKAVGAKKFDILSQFLMEATMVSVAGGTLGILLGTGISLMLSYFAGWATHVSFEAVLLATIFSVSVGIGFGFWPAKKAAGLNPIEALRYE